MSDIKILHLSQCETYLSSVAEFGQQLQALMLDLNSALERAAGVWRDSSIMMARADVMACSRDLSSAIENLQPYLASLRAQVDWARSGQSI